MHKNIDTAYKDKASWARMAIINTASMGKFTSDRAIEDYAKNIWSLTPTTVNAERIQMVNGL